MTSPDMPDVPPASSAGGTADFLANIGNPAMRERIAAALANGTAQMPRSRPRKAASERLPKPAEPADDRPILKTAHGTYRYTMTLDWERGRVRFELERCGVFFLEPDHMAYTRGDRNPLDRVRVQYGDDTDEWYAREGDKCRPGAPTFYGIHICSDSVVNPKRATPDDHDWISVRRPVVNEYGHRRSVSAPGKTSLRCAQVVCALLEVYTALSELPALAHAQDVHKAASRFADHRHTVGSLRGQMAKLARELYEVEQLARAQWALIPDDHPRKGSQNGL